MPPGRYDSSDSEEEENKAPSKATSSGNALSRNINEALRKALEEAACPGAGDEDPEILAAPEEGKREHYRGDETADMDQDYKAEDDHKQDYKASYATEHSVDQYESQMEQTLLNYDTKELGLGRGLSPLPLQNMAERAKYIPLRLTYEERKTLRLVCASISVSDYTTSVDKAFTNKTRRQHTQLQYIVAFLSGLVAASHYDQGQTLLEDRNFTLFETQIQSMLEIARRYKITNPEKLRSEYGRLIYLMQDSVSETLQPFLGANVCKSIKTVYDLLAEANALEVLNDPLLPIATEEILPSKNKNRSQIQLEIKKKEKAIETLVKRYATSSRLTADMIRSCIYSINDNNSFLNSNLKPVLDCIELLKTYFSPDKVEAGYSLTIDEGTNGARLSHNHETQYYYVLQSLTLWSIVLQDMFRLWYLAELDLLNTQVGYELKNTGQGLQRVQQSPNVYKAMHEILMYTKQSLGKNWIGTSVIHLGDHNVPNALVFIDKYTQVARILGPLITTLNNLETICSENEGIKRYLLSYGGIEKAKKDILHDFFTHAFDGSGGDNFFDAGSCIDGRLTSAWNWCSQLASKPYYPLFKLTGFLSFDGEFDK